MQLGIGTVQFGLDYGISNQSGKTSSAEAVRILDYARSQGIVYLDTAALYGNSEMVVGQCLTDNSDYRIITKTIRIESSRIEQSDLETLRATFEQSLKYLGQASVYGLLLHAGLDLLKENGDALWALLCNFKAQGLVQKIGVSVYTATEIRNITERYPIDIIQLPINILDQRLIEGGELKLLQQKGIEIHARSAFMQGLLLMQPDQLPPFFKPIEKPMIDYHLWLKINKLTPLAAALKFIQQTQLIDVLIVGANTLPQCQEICDTYQHLPDQYFDFAGFALKEERYLNPALWKT